MRSVDSHWNVPTAARASTAAAAARGTSQRRRLGTGSSMRATCSTVGSLGGDGRATVESSRESLVPAAAGYSSMRAKGEFASRFSSTVPSRGRRRRRRSARRHAASRRTNAARWRASALAHASNSAASSAAKLGASRRTSHAAACVSMSDGVFIRARVESGASPEGKGVVPSLVRQGRPARTGAQLG